ncbi:hypothetical protein B0H15DRAFT_955308 [Mycena belliarum]|uniref:Uncharacterized protein n=1 Tax=Mycena belliarum TaxID=1033014 RepID=A0AAD6TWJ4_9AGAR|nr:hypothetical protein B0H15DRAFT_955308 [Mycena belliae]
MHESFLVCISQLKPRVITEQLDDESLYSPTVTMKSILYTVALLVFVTLSAASPHAVPTRAPRATCDNTSPTFTRASSTTTNSNIIAVSSTVTASAEPTGGSVYAVSHTTCMELTLAVGAAPVSPAGAPAAIAEPFVNQAGFTATGVHPPNNPRALAVTDFNTCLVFPPTATGTAGATTVTFSPAAFRCVNLRWERRWLLLTTYKGDP